MHREQDSRACIPNVRICLQQVRKLQMGRTPRTSLCVVFYWLALDSIIVSVRAVSPPLQLYVTLPVSGALAHSLCGITLKCCMSKLYVTQWLAASSIGRLNLASWVYGNTFSHLLEKSAWAHTKHILNIDSNKSVLIVYNSRQSFIIILQK